MTVTIELRETRHREFRVYLFYPIAASDLKVGQRRFFGSYQVRVPFSELQEPSKDLTIVGRRIAYFSQACSIH